MPTNVTPNTNTTSPEQGATGIIGASESAAKKTNSLMEEVMNMFKPTEKKEEIKPFNKIKL